MKSLDTGKQVTQQAGLDVSSTYLACMRAGTGILGTGGGGSPYRAKLKLLQILDR